MRQDWEVKELGKLCHITTGKLNANAAIVNGKYPFFTCSRDFFYIDEFAFDCEAILLAGNNAVGDFNVKLYKGKFNAYQRTYVITIIQEKKLLYQYLYLLLENSLKSFKKQSVGAATKFLKIGMIKELKIPIPPLSEQERIVEILDEALTGIATIKANTERNLQNARELFQSYLQSIFSNPSDDWEAKKLGNTCKFLNGKAHENCINDNGEFIVINSKFISSDGIKYKRTNDALFPLYADDIVMVMSDVPNGKALAKCFLINEDNKYTLNQRICAIKSKAFNIRFLYYQLNRNPYFLSFDNGENQTNLRKQDILDCPLLIPPIAEQQKIVEKLDALSAETKRLEAIYQQKLNNLEELKKSLLQKAFNGELTHPEKP